jgi:folate-binding protein YgfZ
MSRFSYAKILANGADAFDFLQAQLTNDLRLLDDVPQILAAWCNPKGRVICLMAVNRTNDGYSIELPAELAESVVRRLTMFRFRSKVDFEIVDDGGTADAAALIASGRPWIGHEQSEEFTPHMLNLDLLGAVSFDKGCFPGQEIVARTHYRGATKRRTQRFESAEPVSVGDRVSDGERDVGEVLNVIGNDVLAVVPTDKADVPLTVNGIALTHIPLEYLQVGYQH